MYLKNLTVLGFKSFADKTALNFQPGVTAIVGPNGCGKSNVSDAIRWVLGEQSAKALRGGEMADVIFNGTDSRKPLGMAEVSLTIGGVDEEGLRASGVEIAYNEVTVTRRVFRDGGSEYFINKTPCRLKDIQQLFMGTGVGRTSYSIMAQGNITQILSSKPEDRRLIFEEAAGITKYKSQKKEALRKLEYAEQNLVRVEDLVREVKRQIGSLQRQAGKARRYKQLSQEMQHLDTQLARHQFDLLQVEIQERETTAERLRNEIESSSAEVLRGEDEITHLRERLSELEHEVGAMQQRGLELKGEIDRHEGRIQFNEERLRELGAQNTKALADINQAEERRHIAEQELAKVDANLKSAETALAQHRATLEARQSALRQVEEDLRRRQEALRQAQADAFAAAQDLTRVRNELTALDLQKQGNVVRLEKLSAEKIQLEEERSRLETRLHEFAANVQTQKLNAQTQRGSVADRQKRLVELQEDLNRAGQEQDELLQQQAEKRSRLNVLEQLQAGHEGFSEGSLAALKQSRHVLGSLADKVRVPDQYVTAIETALGHHLQLVLTEHPEAAQEILADLSANKKGRASVAPLAFTRNGHAPAPVSGTNGAKGNGSSEQSQATAAPELNGEPLEAIRVVDGETSVQPLLERLLGLTRIVRDLGAATAAWRDTNGAFHYVTLAGELLSRHGIYTGGYANGSSNGKGAASILGRKNQIAELRLTAGQLQEQVGELSRRKGTLQSEQTELQASLQQAQTELRAQEVAIATREGEFNALQNSQRLLHQKIDTVVFEVQTVAAQEQEGLQKRSGLAARVNELETQEQERQAQVAELTAQLEGLRLQRDTANAGLTESKVALATEEQMRASFQQQQQSLTQRIRELAQIIEQRRGEIGACIGRKEQAESEIQESRGRIEALRHDRDQVNAQAADVLARKQGEEAEITGREESLREQRRSLTDVQQRRGTIEVELAQKNMAVQNLRERVQQKYHVNLDDVRSECITITFADEGPARIHVMSPEEMAAAGAATDWEMVAQQVEALQKRLDEMGPVNLVAIEEYDETEQRYQFLSKQHDDLVQAKAQLLEVINRINSQTKEMFRTTFEQIRTSFRAMFTEVFGGGKADLILMDENDLLESGIDIVARPPGKQLQTISLLSGGEQTMTAVSLLFSIYQVKPSPFCVLDELDAPLDESNINRFIRVLQRFLERSQFIIITHNKRTIGMADVLYGVTMQEHGVSKIVSVKFHKSDEEVTDHPTASLETPTTGRSIDADEDAPHKRDETIEVMMAK
ncbi:MAG TPA: chromosome segregation protein SMC [Candidatus Acidoferrum sp.]|jgi:chromosome segregation protein|nr:chromosome segregation protein SMC [Candidatus Acidoferrum sp.]